MSFPAESALQKSLENLAATQLQRHQGTCHFCARAPKIISGQHVRQQPEQNYVLHTLPCGVSSEPTGSVAAAATDEISIWSIRTSSCSIEDQTGRKSGFRAHNRRTGDLRWPCLQSLRPNQQRLLTGLACICACVEHFRPRAPETRHAVGICWLAAGYLHACRAEGGAAKPGGFWYRSQHHRLHQEGWDVLSHSWRLLCWCAKGIPESFHSIAASLGFIPCIGKVRPCKQNVGL